MSPKADRKASAGDPGYESTRNKSCMKSTSGSRTKKRVSFEGISPPGSGSPDIQAGTAKKLREQPSLPQNTPQPIPPPSVARTGSTSQIKSMAKIIAADNDFWPGDDDGMICFLKNYGASSVEISHVVQRNEHEVRERYKHLISCSKNKNVDVTKIGNLYAEVLEKRGKFGDMKVWFEEGGWVRMHRPAPGDADNKQAETAGGKGKGKDVSENKGTDRPKDKAKKSKSSSKKTKKTKKAKGKDEEVCPTPVSTPVPSSDSEGGFVHIPEAGSPSTSDASTDDYNAPKITPILEILSEMNQERKRLRPDGLWSEEDCRILSILEARYNADKWLHIQAEFANLTGRMVDAQLLQYKFEEPGFDEDNDEDDE
ncbi:hypothetical protein AAE478_005006 [Parahypoxylon ruwenzoriense]